MTINLSDETLAHLTAVLDFAGRRYLDELTKAEARSTTRPTRLSALRARLAEVRDLQAIFAEHAEPAPSIVKPDFDVVQDGSVFLFTIDGDDVLAYVKERVQVESWQWLGTRAFAVDHRLAPDLCYQLREDGWTVVVR